MESTDEGWATALESQTECAAGKNGSPKLMGGVIQSSLGLLAVLFVFSQTGFSQTTDPGGDGRLEIANSSRTIEPAPSASLRTSSDASAASASNSERPFGWKIAVYPVLAWAPVFGASVTIPPVPSHPIGPSEGSTDGSFNGAYFGGARFEKGKWSADALFMWAGLSAERVTPLAKVSLDFVFGHAMGGREVLPNLYVEGGFRRIALNLHATVGDASDSGSPGYWDPLVGVTYRRQLGRKWRILLHGDGGGFGVGSDVDIAAMGRADWQFARHYGITMGYGGMHLSDSETKPEGTLSVRPTLHGPIAGFGIFF